VGSAVFSKLAMTPPISRTPTPTPATGALSDATCALEPLGAPTAPAAAGGADAVEPTEAATGYQPYVEPERPSIFSLPLAHLPLVAPLRWLQQGWRDFWRCPHIGLFYGLAFFGMGHALWAVLRDHPAYVLALSAGFLLMGPFLCLGLYHASRCLEAGAVPQLGASLRVGWPTRGAMGLFAGVLLVLELLWGRASLVVFALTFNTLPSGQDTLTQLLNPDNLGFIATYLAVGGVFAGLIFAVSVIAIPMILDRQVDAISAGLTSIRACLHNPGTLLFWGACIAVLVGLSMAPYFLGLIVVGPVIGHATWHAYRAIVPPDSDSSGRPESVHRQTE
jgi:uncharacterized membrane protein